MASDQGWPGARWLTEFPAPYRRAYRWLQALQTRVWGCPGVMRPRPLSFVDGGPFSLYDLSPLRARLQRHVDFDRLNDGAIRLSVVTTDLETGEAVVFDTRRGDRIGPQHLIASCGFPPEFPPVEIDGRLLADGGLVANAPIEVVVDDEANRAADLLCFVVDLFDARSKRPITPDQAAVIPIDLLFANQTARALRAFERAERFRQLAGCAGGRATVVPVCYQGGPDEPGPQKLFDFSSVALAARWAAGRADMSAAIASRPAG